MNETERVRKVYQRLAPRYDRIIRSCDRWLFEGGRAWIGAHAEGRVLEIGVGTGLNLPYYGEDVQITGIDISPSMLAIARSRGDELRLDMALNVGDAQSLDFPDQTFDTVVFSLAVCSIPDAGRAFAEASRVLRPGGRIVLMEHVRSPFLLVRSVQRLLDPLFVRLQADHLMREPLDHVATAELWVERVIRTRLGIVERMLARKT